MNGSVDPPESRFEALAKSAPDAILTIDENSIILSANPAAARIFGYSPEELIGGPLNRLIPERLRAAHDAGVARYLRTGRRNIPWTGVQLPALTKSGTEIPMEISFGEFVEPDGRHVFSGFVRDISERVRYERDLEDARATAVAARHEAETALRELRALGRVTDVAIGRSTYDEMLHELLARLSEELAVDEASVLLVDEATHELVMSATHGPPDMADLATRIPLGTGVAGRVAATGEPLVIEELSTEQVVSPRLAAHMASTAAVPVRSENRVVGVLRVSTRGQRTFAPENVHLLEIVADRMAGALARTRLFEAERRARGEAEAARQQLAEREAEQRRLFDELEERAREERTLRTLAQSITGAVRIGEVMHQIAEGALAVSNASGAFVERVIEVNGEVEVVAASGEHTPPVGERLAYPGSLTEEIVRRREPVFLVRLEGIGAAIAPYLDENCPGCSALVLPLLTDDSTLGALVLLRDADEPPFPDAIINRVRTLGDLASLSLQRLIALAESERRRTEAEAAVRSRDEVLSVVSHDLRNPVSTVAMSAALLNDPEVQLSDEDQRKQLAVITRSASRMNRLIQDLLDVARIEGGRLTIKCRCEDAAALAAEACESFRTLAQEKSIELACDVDEKLPQVYADRDRVLQVLSNYLNNALKFTPTSGRIALATRATDEGGVRFAVSDTGPGIAPEDIPRAFTRFWQAKRTAHLGSGLGLAIAKGIAEAHRGRVWVESTPGQGSTFYLELPHSKECD